MSCRIVAASACLACLFAFSVAGAQDKGDKSHDKHAAEKAETPKLPICPVMDEPVDFNVKTMTDDGPVYFCCGGCIRKFEKDAAKYEKRVGEQRAALAKLDRVQVVCPVSHEPVDGKTTLKTDKGEIAFCCDSCKGKYEQEPAKYQARLADSYTYQTRCPVSGEKIDGKSFVDMPTGERVYVCCPGCAGKIEKDPEKYASKLAEQGINLNMRKLKRMQAEAEKKAEHP
ncbi:MAG: hypothetical protein KDA32_05480 [Phycisphaerales bacterium]|nr:hypothetical protein [Phycisphaerales bacterium]